MNISDDNKSNISPGREIHDYPSHWQFESGIPLETDTAQHIYDPLQSSQSMAPLVPSSVFEEQGASFANLPEAYDAFQFSHHVFHSPLDKTYHYSQPVIAYY